MKVLITGGSGYLGQFLVCGLAEQGHHVALLYGTKSDIVEHLPGSNVSAYKVDLQTGEGLDSCIASLGHPDVIVNCAAISQPGVCEKEPDRARAVNIPSTLLKSSLVSLSPQPLFIHISTDQVYEGTQKNSKEEQAGSPVNQYGKSKFEAEEAVRQQWANHVILRSSIIYGPLPPLLPVDRALFVQFLEGALAPPAPGAAPKAPTSFFEDEFRCPIHVHDIVAIVAALLTSGPALPPAQRTLNMGGEERLSRVDMARTVAKVQQYDTALIEAVPAASVNRGVTSPPDISMDVSLLKNVLGIKLMTFEEGIRQIFVS